MLVSRLRVRPPPHFVRAASSFPPKKKPRHTPSSGVDRAVDPVVFHQLRQRIIERHNPARVELDGPRVDLLNENILNIRRGLKEKDLTLVRSSWEELRRANHLHVLTEQLVEQIARLGTASLHSSAPLGADWDSERRLFVEEVVLTAAASQRTDVLNACLLAYLQRGDSRAVLKLYEKYKKQLPQAQPTPETDPDSLEDEFADILASERRLGRVNVVLSVVTAYAMEGSFQDALSAYIEADLAIPRYATEAFVQTLSHDSALQKKVQEFAERLHLAKAISRPLSLSKHIHNLSTQPASPVLEELYNSILAAMSQPGAYIAPDPQLMTSAQPVAMTEVIWASFLAAFLRRERNDLAAKLWKDVTEFGVQPGILTWNAVMNVYSDRGAVKEFMGAWSTMAAHGVKPDGSTYRALLSCLLAKNKVTEALHWFQTFEREVQPTSTSEQNLAVHNALVHGLLHLGRNNASIAFSLLQKMEKEGPSPDLVSYNTLLGYHSRQGEFKAMATIINRMSAAGVQGDVFTFSTILTALLKAGREDAPDMVLNIMRKQGVHATVATYTAIINSQMREQSPRHLGAALRMLDQMEKNEEVAPNEITYTSVLAGLYRGSWLPAEQVERYRKDIMGRMKERKLKFKTGGYNILIKACLSSKEPAGLEDALGFYREMVRDKVPLHETWYVLLAGLLERGEWQVAREIVDEMFASGAQPTKSVLRLVRDINEHENTIAYDTL